jgi:hypothetical protein
MRPLPFYSSRITALLVIILFSITAGYSQVNQSNSRLDFKNDTVSSDAVTQAALKYKSDLSAAGKKATNSIRIEVDKLKEILDACAANGIANVSFMIVTIRKEDTAHYGRHNYGLTATERNDLVGRQQLIIRVPRSAFAASLGKAGGMQGSSLMTSLLLMGLVPLDKLLADLPPSSDDLFFSLGSICPPPSICN